MELAKLSPFLGIGRALGDGETTDNDYDLYT